MQIVKLILTFGTNQQILYQVINYINLKLLMVNIQIIITETLQWLVKEIMN